MASIKLGEHTVYTVGELPEIGSTAPDFELTKTDLSSFNSNDLRGSRVVLNIFPSLDTGICSASVRRFNQEAANMENTRILCISKDLPFAQKRFCGAEGIEDVLMLSDFKSGSFGKAYGLEMADGVMQGFLSRVVLILDEDGTVVYSEQVPQIGQEPDYESALNAL